MISLENVSYAFPDYQDHEVLQDIKFTVNPGDTLVILGDSGSGKTTILKIILGLLKPTSGRVIIDGEEITPLKEQELMRVRRKIGMVFQEGALFDSMTVGENVAFCLKEQSGWHGKEMESRVHQILGFVDMEDCIDKMPDELSGGMRRRVAIARALASSDPKIMLYDEPTTGLDPITADTICDLINKLRDQQKVSSVMVTHLLRDAFKVGTRFMILYEGRIIFEGTERELKSSAHPYIKKFLA
jgi:phospholipid/cholesterol/gamma-HCH transport system ATP-binding protein